MHSLFITTVLEISRSFIGDKQTVLGYGRHASLDCLMRQGHLMTVKSSIESACREQKYVDAFFDSFPLPLRLPNLSLSHFARGVKYEAARSSPMR